MTVTISISLRPDEEGFIGRECPEEGCLGYFKVQNGTGLTDPALPGHCPYCGFSAGQDHFYTREQLAYAESVAMQQVTKMIFGELRNALPPETKPRGAFGIGLKFTLKEGPLPALRLYREKELETVIVCNRCALRYAIYGWFAFCPDCGEHNSFQILEANLELCLKQISVSESLEPELSKKLVHNALKDAVSTFDGFGRQLCKTYAAKSRDATKAQRLSFQNLPMAQNGLKELWGFDLKAVITENEWLFVCRCFQKRHLLTHTMGVIDEPYLKKTGDSDAVMGHKVSVEAREVRELVELLKTLGKNLATRLS